MSIGPKYPQRKTKAEIIDDNWRLKRRVTELQDALRDMRAAAARAVALLDGALDCQSCDHPSDEGCLVCDLRPDLDTALTALRRHLPGADQ